MTYVVTASGKRLDLVQAGLIYLASPYTKYPHGIDEAFRDICKVAARLLKDGIKFYSPIMHSHPMAVHGDVDPLDHGIWLPFQKPLMDACSVMLVCELDGWQRSYGIAWETAHFVAVGKPVVYLDPVRFTLSPNPGACALPAEEPEVPLS